MKWFRHYTDATTGRSINTLLDEFSHLGPFGYFTILECCYQKIDLNDDFFLRKCGERVQQNPEESQTNAGAMFEFSPRVLRQRLRTSQSKLGDLLECCQRLGLLNINITQTKISIKIPNLLEFLAPNDRTKLKKLISNYSKITPDKIRTRGELDKIRGEERRGTKVPTTTNLASKIRYGPLSEFKEFNNESLLILENVSQSSQKSWIKLYPINFIGKELIKIKPYLDNNPRKCPKTKKGMSGFVTSWMSRGWEWQRKNEPGKSNFTLREDMVSQGNAETLRSMLNKEERQEKDVN